MVYWALRLKAHLDFTASLQNGATAIPSLPSLAAGTWDHKRVMAHQDNPSHARGGLGLGRHGISLLPPSPSLVSKQECLNAFYVVTQMMKGLKMGLTKTSCTSE